MFCLVSEDSHAENCTYASHEKSYPKQSPLAYATVALGGFSLICAVYCEYNYIPRCDGVYDIIYVGHRLILNSSYRQERIAHR